MILSRFFQVASVLILRGTGILVGFIIQVLLARWIGPAGVGIYYLFISWQNLTGTFFGGGFPLYVVRKVSFHEAEKEQKLSWSLTITIISHLIGFGLLVLVLLFYFVPDIASFLFETTELNGLSETILLYFIAINGFGIITNQILSGSFKGIGNSILSIIIEFNLIPILSIVGLGYLYLSDTPITILAYLFIYTGANILTMLFGLSYWIFRKVDFKKGFEKLRYPRKLYDKSIAKFWGVNMLNTINNNAAFYIMPFLLTADEIGIFGANQRLVSLANTMLIAMASIFTPNFAKYFKLKDFSKLKLELQHSQIYSLLAYAPVFLALIIFPETILSLFGPEFKTGVTLLIVMAFGQLFNCGTGLVGQLLGMVEEENKMLYVNAINVFFSTSLLVILGIYFGLFGVAIAYSISIASKNLLAYYFANQTFSKLLVNK